MEADRAGGMCLTHAWPDITGAFDTAAGLTTASQQSPLHFIWSRIDSANAGSLAMHPMPPPDSDAPSASYQGRLLASPAAASQPATQLQQAGRAFAASPQQQQQQQQQRQAKMTVRFDSQVPAISPQTVAAATPQHPHPHGYHPAHRSAHDAGEGVGAGQQSAKKNEQQQWREELEVSCLCVEACCAFE